MLIGIVGKPNVGKSTFFKALTLAEVEIADYPFVTIKPNSGIGYVKVACACKDFKKACKPREGFCLDGKRFVPVQLIDVAGLVPGAHEGKGMGNQFLDDLRQADALIHIIDISGSTNEKGEKVEPGQYDPAEDIKFLEEEIDLWYFGIINRNWDRFVRAVMAEKGDIRKAIAKQLSGLKVTEPMVEKAVNSLNLGTNAKSWSQHDLMKLASSLRKTTKPMILACNKADMESGKKNLERLKQEFPDHILVPCSAESELALREAAKHGLINYIPGEALFNIVDDGKLTDKQRSALTFIKDNVLKLGSTGVQDVLDKAVFELLKYITVFPVPNAHLQDADGRILPDCLLVPSTTTAHQLAYHIHTDIGDKFVKAIDIRKNLPLGKDAALHDRDVVEIKTS
ncbi:MAG: redox-regulated ATPase YchF [Nanoarchaeota archaeon]|nr:redox-regulated ATPase YchF [Nanoarchaeota archaeon]